MNRLAVKIKEARIKAKMSEKDLAKACGQNINYILQIESGKKVINEQIAEQILKILGEKIEFFQDKEEAPKDIVKKPEPKKVIIKEEMKAITPTDQWADALSGVIKAYAVTDENGKAIDSKELSIISKKVDGVQYDKVSFVKLTNSQLPQHRLFINDVITLQSTNEYSSNGIYYIEYGQKKFVRYVEKINNTQVIISTGKNENEIEVGLKAIKIIGKAIKVEHYL
ncbi:helix-turn-helix domain-containing protein [Fusibacter bizertensis]